MARVSSGSLAYVIMLSLLICTYLIINSSSPINSSQGIKGVELCSIQPSKVIGRCYKHFNSSSYINVCECMVCISKIIYEDNYSEAPNPLVGGSYFPGMAITSVDLISGEVSRYVLVNLTNYHYGAGLIRYDEILERFTYCNVDLKEFYEGVIKPKVKFLGSDGDVNISIVLLRYKKLNCISDGCIYSYKVISDLNELQPYLNALNIWGMVFNNVFQLRTVIKEVNLSRSWNVFIDNDGDLRSYMDLIFLVSEELKPLGDNLIIFIEAPSSISFSGELLIAFNIDNFIVTSSRDIDTLIHEVGHVLGLTHPVVQEFRPSLGSSLFHESVMSKSLNSNLKRVTLGDVVGLAYSTALLLKEMNSTAYSEFIRRLSSLGIDPNNLTVKLPLVKRTYVSNELPEPIAEIISEGVIMVEVDDGDLKYVKFNDDLIEFLKFLQSPEDVC